MKEYLKLIRVKHWLKNLLVLFPIFFNMNIHKIKYSKILLLAFIVFCFTSSIIYVFNDISDIEKDKLHPTKKLRPLASGKISKKNAVITLITISIINIVLIGILYNINKSVLVIIIPAIYIIMNLLYSKVLKNIPIIDVSIIVTGFVLRVMYGGIVTNVTVSKYLYLMIIFGAYFLAFGKRRNEMIKNGTKSRKSLKLYNKDFLDKNMYVMLSLAIVSYTLWCVDKETITRIGKDNIYWTIPIVILILEMYSLNIEKDSNGDPIEVILESKMLLVTIFIYFCIMTFMLYF
ncbi:MAG: UbiA prenyltransferase family protein [Bacilli bacterium]|nr:UbiA prenyltransferase family protein [Bacilli bacterium]